MVYDVIDENSAIFSRALCCYTSIFISICNWTIDTISFMVWIVLSRYLRSYDLT